MKISCVISEFDPFHNGHKYLLEKQRENGATHIAAIMSGSFVQRGKCSALSKFDRAEAAISCGADLVIELPVVWACAAAPVFARGGVAIIKALGVADSIFFGSECGDISLLERCADAMLSAEFKTAFARHNNGENPYAAAVQLALSETAGDDCAEVLSSPNNILAVEYIKELRRSGAEIAAETVKRAYVEHDSSRTDSGFASASFIRSNIDDLEPLRGFMPPAGFEIIKSAAQRGDTADMSRLENVIMYKLRTTNAAELRLLPDVSEGLENRLMRAAVNSSGLEELMSRAVCKRYSHPRISRALACALLGVNADMQSRSPEYIRVLALNQRGAEIIRLAKRECALPIITKAAAYRSVLGGHSAEIFEKDILATDLRSLACRRRSAPGEDFLRGVYFGDKRRS